MTRVRSRGFTMVEIIIVVSIIGLMMAIAFSSLTKAKSRQTLDRVAVDMADRLTRGREFAEVAIGARAGTTRLQLDPSCGVAGNIPVFRIDPGAETYTIPTSAAVDAADMMTVSCTTYSIQGGGLLGSRQLETGPASPGSVVTYELYPNGRILPNPNIAMGERLFRIRHPADETQQYAFRILPSGIICPAGYDASDLRCAEE